MASHRPASIRIPGRRRGSWHDGELEVPVDREEWGIALCYGLAAAAALWAVAGLLFRRR